MHQPDCSYFLYDATCVASSIVIDVFFREINQRGAYQIPLEGPLIFVAAPHANQFVDPLVLLKHCQRRIGFLIAKKSYDRKLIGNFSKLMNAIPVARPQDHARSGTGKIYLKADQTLIGLGTKFTLEVKVKDSIALHDGRTAEVAAVESDTQLVLKRPFDDGYRLKMDTLEIIVGESNAVRYKIFPHLEQSQVYKAVHERLNNGDCIGIFPEGGSHDRAELLPLKAGVSVMALGAMAENPELNVRIIPCGLNYFHPHRFRSRAVVEFGKPITISDDLVSQYKMGGDGKRQACSALMQTIYSSLRAVTVNAPDYETLQVIQAARRLYRPTKHELNVSQKLEITRRFAEGYDRFKDMPQIQKMKEHVLTYNRLLRAYYMGDHQVAVTKIDRTNALLLLLRRLFQLVLMALLALPGVILNLPIVLITIYIKAKNSSAVKIAGRDVLATWKLIVALVVGPLFYLMYAIIYTAFFAKEQGTWWRVALSILLFLPILALGTMKFFETSLDIYKSLAPLWLAVWNPQQTQELRHMRWALQTEIDAIVEELAPQVSFTHHRGKYENVLQIIPNFSKDRVLNKRPHFDRVSPIDDGDDWLMWKEVTEDESDDIFFFGASSSKENKTL